MQSASIYYELLFVLVLGLCLGSFATVICSRLPYKRNIFTGRSNCPKCKKKLKILDLFPLFSWVFQGGKCRYCKSRISIEYPLIEITTMFSILLVYINTGFSFDFIIISLITLCLISIIFIDLKLKIIPDEIQICLLFLALIFQIYHNAEIFFIIVAPITAFLFGLILRWAFFFWKRREALGMGDVKFLAPAALLVGLKGLVPFLFYAGIIGVISGTAWKIVKKEDDFPFAPALCASLFTCILFPSAVDSFWNLYGIFAIFS